MSTDVDNVASETTADKCGSIDKCTSKSFTVHSLIGHNGIVTAVAMSDCVLVSARCVLSVTLHVIILV